MEAVVKRRAARRGDAAAGARRGWVCVRGSEVEVEMETVREDGNKRGKLKKEIRSEVTWCLVMSHREK